MQKYKNNVIKCIAFLAGLCLLLGVFSFVFFPKDNRAEAGMHFVETNGIFVERKNSIDVLVVGDSESYLAFSPMQIWREHGYTTYVCGIPVQPPYGCYEYVRKVLETQSPKLIILETNTVFRTEGVIEDSMAIFSQKLKTVMPIFDYHDRWKKLTVQDFTTMPKRTWTHDLKGFRYRPKIISWTGTTFMKKTDQVMKIPFMPRTYIEKIHDLCKERDIPFLLVSVPSPINWDYKRHNGVQQFADKNQIPFLDMNLKVSELQIDWKTDSLDNGDHVNFTGARKVTAYFGKYLEEQYALPDHRQDPDFQSWNDAQQRYQQMVQQKKDEIHQKKEDSSK